LKKALKIVIIFRDYLKSFKNWCLISFCNILSLMKRLKQPETKYNAVIFTHVHHSLNAETGHRNAINCRELGTQPCESLGMGWDQGFCAGGFASTST
jgi:hypothetical protein